MDDVWGDFLGTPHRTTPAAVIANKPMAVSSKILHQILFGEKNGKNNNFTEKKIMYRLVSPTLDYNLGYTFHARLI